MSKADIGLIGLAVMGENLIMNMESKGFTVAVYNRTVEKVDKFVNGRGKDKKIIGAQSVRELADVKIYIDATIEMRIYRRIARNVQRGQTIEFIGGYYLNFARWREKKYSLPSAQYADWRVDNEYGFDIDAEGGKILAKLNA